MGQRETTMKQKFFEVYFFDLILQVDALGPRSVMLEENGDAGEGSCWAEQAVLIPRSGASQRSWVLELSGPGVNQVKIDGWEGAMQSNEWARGEAQVSVPREASTCLPHLHSAFIPAQIDGNVSGGLGEEHGEFCISVRIWLWKSLAVCWECSLRASGLLRVQRAGSLLAQGGEGVGAGGRQAQRQRNSRPRCPQGFLRKIHSRFELYKNRLLLPFTCDSVNFF